MKYAFAAALVAVANAAEWGYSYPSSTTYYQPARSSSSAQAAGYANAGGKACNSWDAWSRDQDLSIDESYGNTNA